MLQKSELIMLLCEVLTDDVNKQLISNAVTDSRELKKATFR